MFPGRGLLCLLGALVVSTGLAQEIVHAKAIPSTWLTNHLSVAAVFPGPNGDGRPDANSSDVGIGMRLNLPMRPLRFDDNIRFQDSAPVQTEREATQWRRAMESAERENLRLMNDYRTRAASPAAPPVQPQLHPSAVEIILNGPGR